MRERGALALGSTLAAAVVGTLGLSMFFQWTGDIRHFRPFAGELLVLALLPTMMSACVSSVWVSRSPTFGQRGALANAVRISLLAFPVLFVVLWATIWTWLQFERHLPPYERPATLSAMAATAGSYTLLAFAVGIVPAICIEYFVIRFVRKRWSPALAPGVSP